MLLLVYTDADIAILGQEYTGNAYDATTPRNSPTPGSSRDDCGNDLAVASPISPSRASLHSYLQQIDSQNQEHKNPGSRRKHLDRRLSQEEAVKQNSDRVSDK